MRAAKGEGSLREKRPGVWEVRARIEGEPISRTVHGDKRAALRAKRRLLTDIEEGKVQRRHKRREAAQTASERTVRAAAERWLDMAGPDFAPGTVRNYRQFLRLYIYPAIGDRPLVELETTELDDLYIAMRKKGLAPATVRQCHAVVSRILHMATRWGWAHDKPTENVTLPRLLNGELEIPEPSDVRRFIDTAEAEGSLELATLFFLAAATGARRGEACALRWSDVDFTTSTLFYARNLVDGAGDTWLEKDTKTHGIRTNALDPATLAALRLHRRRMEQRAVDGGTVLGATGFVFSRSLDGSRPWRGDSVGRSFRRIRRKLGVPETIKFHSLRHFSASQQLAHGVDVRTVAGRHGWKDATMPLNRYGHFIPAADIKAAEVMGALLRPDAKERRLPPAAEPGEDGAEG